MWLMNFVACFHASSQSTVPHASSLYARESKVICSLEAGPRPMRRQSAAALMSAPLHECSLSSFANAARTASAHPSRGPRPVLSIWDN